MAGQTHLILVARGAPEESAHNLFLSILTLNHSSKDGGARALWPSFTNAQNLAVDSFLQKEPISVSYSSMLSIMILVSTRHSTVIIYLFLFIQLILCYRDIYILFQNLWLQRSGVVWLLVSPLHLLHLMSRWCGQGIFHHPIRWSGGFGVWRWGVVGCFFLGMCLPPVKRVMAPPKKRLVF